MAQTKEGAAKAKEAQIQNLMKENGITYEQANELRISHMREIGSKGGKLGKGHGFSHGTQDPRVIGRLGGLAPRRKAKMPTPYDN